MKSAERTPFGKCEPEMVECLIGRGASIYDENSPIVDRRTCDCKGLNKQYIVMCRLQMQGQPPNSKNIVYEIWDT